MPETFDETRLPAAKAARYAALGEEIAAVLEGEPDRTARMATVAAMLAQAFDDFFWCGFYVVDPTRPSELVVGPYQGTLGCLRIAFGRGVCGTAAAERRTVVVPDVEAFPGHIACDARARSEIVVPVFDGSGALIAVLDIDATELAAFDETDAAALESILAATFAAGGSHKTDKQSA
ncbi:MAG TPA: GAF domain-containing protein [Caulobacteraceae bacterium]|nr:GAF domain-containing protein [Caulobacteraceae bacterium]